MPNSRFFLPLALAPWLALPVSAENAALLIGNSDYEHARDMDNGQAVTDTADTLRDAGLSVETLRDADRGEIGAALRRLEAAGEDADRLLVALSGRFVRSDSETWFLPVDAEAGSVAEASLDAIPLSSITEILERTGRRSVLLLATMLDQRGEWGSLDEGIGPIDIPGDVTLIEAWPVAARTILSDTLAVPGEALEDRLSETEWADLRGDLPSGWSFLSSETGERSDSVGTGERAFWQRARDGDSEESYIAYLDAYPEGEYAAEAIRRLAEVRQAPQSPERAAEAALGLDRAARRGIQRDLVALGYDTRGIDGIFGPGTRGAIERWQGDNDRPRTGYLDAGMAARIAEQADSAETPEDRFWRETGEGTDEAGLIRFLERYPDGARSDRAERRLREIRDGRLTVGGISRREEVLWNQARESDTVEAYTDYARAFPRGVHADEARQRMSQLRQGGGRPDEAARAREEALGLPELMRRTVEQRLAGEGFDPGTPDGQFDDRTRLAIRAYQETAQLPGTGYLDQETIVRLLQDTVQRALSR
ncbi:peptidoglycan-binding protein [Palleronia sp. LCG004]|uniref:peptidoglycan-binding protein n=1 Tax=Palleronia sp. LCG004 TaxID=3079304 RepID=UPI0029438A98|nr:peptidoglycan-binding protein [Palleronia sp. LCG004]WOI55419.1 peptidoglycan-binding protein [Palleronia sp. LCG004]